MSKSPVRPVRRRHVSPTPSSLALRCASVETETVPPELAARFAQAERRPEYRAAIRPAPRGVRWVVLALLVLVVGGVTAGIWVVAFTADDFADARGTGASVAGIVTAVM